MLLSLLTHAQKECTHQLALPWGTRHLISPGLAGKDVMMVLLGRACAENCIMVAEGVLQHSGTFKVRALGFPPVELRGESRAAAKVGSFLAPVAGTACMRIPIAVGLL